VLPPVLVLHLKRFSHGFGTGKISKHVRFEQSIEIPSKQGKIAYDLNGIIVHRGGSLHSGHYVAFVKVGCFI
jgi:ubiquitin carboxyl-terminal hydrolase 36/42